MATDVLLLSTPTGMIKEHYDMSRNLNSMPPLGLMYIYSYLEEFDYKVEFIDLIVDSITLGEFKNKLISMNPKIVGITSYIEGWDVQLSIYKLIKEVLPDSKIVLGGHTATFCYEDLFKTGYIDYIIKREGEVPLKKLCDYIIKDEININSIPNLIYRKNAEIIHNDIFFRVENLDTLPYPNRRDIDIDKYTYPLTICTSRGCPGKCIFCSSSNYLGNKVVYRDIDNIIDEILYEYNRTGQSHFFIVDDTFTINKKRVLNFCEKLIDIQQKKNIDFVWGCESRVDTIDQDVMIMLSNAGCVMMQFGMESGNDFVLKSIKKNTTYTQLYNAVELAYKHSIQSKVSVIIGHFSDTEETINETIDKAVKLKKEFKAIVAFAINTPFPGTDQFINSSEYGIELCSNKETYYNVNKAMIDTKHLSANELDTFFHKAVKKLHF